jgi:CXXC-20-CXXC protein
MQKCLNCGYQFTKKEINKSYWLGYRDLICHECGTKYKVKTSMDLSKAMALDLAAGDSFPHIAFIFLFFLT